MALTKRQREWAQRVYSQGGVLRCHFPLYSEERGWHFCGSTREVQIHHISPQGYIKRMPVGDGNPDYPLNLIALCIYHHVGKGYKDSLNWWYDVVPVVHTDAAWAFRNYTRDNASFERVFEGRIDRTDRGLKYWNTDWDEALLAIATEIVWEYLVTRPDDRFP